jgi:large subunit ribosomal protein L29
MKMKIKDIKALGSDELIAKEREFKKELFELNAQRQLGKIEKPASVRVIKKNIARILTVLNEKKQNGK